MILSIVREMSPPMTDHSAVVASALLDRVCVLVALKRDFQAVAAPRHNPLFAMRRLMTVPVVPTAATAVTIRLVAAPAAAAPLAKPRPAAPAATAEPTRPAPVGRFRPLDASAARKILSPPQAFPMPGSPAVYSEPPMVVFAFPDEA